MSERVGGRERERERVGGREGEMTSGASLGFFSSLTGNRITLLEY